MKSEQVEEARAKRGISADFHGISIIGMYAEPEVREHILLARKAAQFERESAGGDSSSRTAETTASGVGSERSLFRMAMFL